MTTEIERAKQYRDQAEALVLARGQVPVADRNTLLIAYWSLGFEIHRGILSLLQQQLYGPAFALLRTIVETNVRAHVALFCSEEVLKTLLDDSYRTKFIGVEKDGTKFSVVGKEIDEKAALEGLMQRFLKEAVPLLHSFTHAGLAQLSRRFKGDDLIPDYSDHLIQQLIRVSTSAVFMVNNLVTKHFGFEEEWKKNTDLFEEWGKRE